MCIDYTGLNKACPKDPFPLPRIDQVVDSTSGCDTLCFLDAYSVYHQIVMKESDQLVTSFMTLFGSFCYVTMSLGLKNTGAMYQHCMLKCFGDLPRDAWHIRGFPCKNVFVIAEEVDERAFLFGGERGTDAYRFTLRVVGVYEDLLRALC